MAFNYKTDGNKSANPIQYQMLASDCSDDITNDSIVSDDRLSFYFESIVHDLEMNFENEIIDIGNISNLLDVLCSSIDGIGLAIKSINSQICASLIDYFSQSPLVISRVFQKIVIYSPMYDELIIAQKTLFMNKLLINNDELITNNMISIISTISRRHPESMVEFINVLFTKKVNKDIAQYIYSIIPVAQRLIQNIDEYKKISCLISQIIICNDQDVILIGIKIISLAIDCKDNYLMQSFGESQILYESLLYNNEVKKIAAGYCALTITLCCQKNRISCIKNSGNIFKMAEVHIKLIPNILKHSIIQYVCEYSRLVKSCIPQNLFMNILQIANEGSFFLRNDAVNCIAISIIETKIKIINISQIVSAFAGCIDGNKIVILNIINALNVICDYAILENKIKVFRLEVLNQINFDDLMHDEDPEIQYAAEAFIKKIAKTWKNKYA